MIPNQEEMGPPPSRGRTARASLSSPFPPDANRWEPLGCGQCVGCSVWAGGRAWQSRAEPDRAGQPRPAGSELLPGMSHRNLGVGREAKGSAGGSVLSHLISSHLVSSPHLQRSEEDLICRLGEAAPPAALAAYQCPGALLVLPGTPGEAWPHRGGDTRHGDTRGAGSSGWTGSALPSRAGRLCRHMAALDRIPQTLKGL